MPTLLLKFRVFLEDLNLPIIARHHGPLFHRWLPDSEKDAIVLDTKDNNVKLKVWFERFGFVDKKGWIRFDLNQQEVDPEVIPTQAILDAGPLFGLLKIKGLSKEDITPLRKNMVGHTRYKAFGKKIVQKIIYPQVSRLLDILRINYGQYWIRKLKKWDSRSESLGSYCTTELRLRWSLDNGKTWQLFEPDKNISKMQLTVNETFFEYLVEKDWSKINELIKNGYEPSIAAIILNRTHQFIDEENLKQALIEGITALEIALNEFINQRLDEDSPLRDYVPAFLNIPLVSRVTIVATTLGKIPAKNVEYSIEAIKNRNKVVHEGYNPPETVKPQLIGLINTIAALLPDPGFKFPSANPGNVIKSVEEWEKDKE